MPTEVSSGKKALENAEDVIRAVGDGVFPLKIFKTIEGNLGAIKINKYLSGLIIYINQFRW